MEPNIVIAVDLGTNMGWASYVNGGIASGHVKLKKPQDPHAVALLNMTETLLDILNAALNQLPAGAEQQVIVIYEDVKRHVSTLSAHAYGGYLAVLRSFMWMFENQIDRVPVGVGVGQIKKFATGSGKAEKAAMIAAANKLKGNYHGDMLTLMELKKLIDEGEYIADDNEADAVCLLFYYLDKIGVYSI